MLREERKENMNDNEIIALFFARKENAISAAAEKYGRYCHTIAHNILSSRPDAEECVNDTYLNAWNSIPPHQPERLAPFIGRIARNLALNRYKSNHAQKRSGDSFAVSLDELDECIPSVERTEDTVMSDVTGKHISNFLRKEPRNARSVFVCRYFYGEAVKNIAERFGYSDSKVKSMLQRTRNRLRDYLQKEGITV